MSSTSGKTDLVTETLEDEQKKVDVMKDVEFKQGKRFGEWRIEKEIDEGEYGKIYSVKNEKNGTMAALKAESNALEGGSALKLEWMLLRSLHAKKPALHFTEIFAAAKHDKYSYMIMTLLGPDVKQLLKKCNGKFTAGTWSRVGMQCLYAIKYVHDHGFVHRHIKPRNFLLGLPTPGTEACRIVHLIDFGLARQFAYYNEMREWWHGRKPREDVLFRGDLRYASLNAHTGEEQGRGDDLYSLVFMLFEMSGGGLPWHSEQDVEKVKEMKREFIGRNEMISIPTWTTLLLDTLFGLSYYLRPEYELFFDVLDKVLTDKYLNNHEKVTSLSKYDWEDKASPSKSQTAHWQDRSFYLYSALKMKTAGYPWLLPYRGRRHRKWPGSCPEEKYVNFFE